MKIAHIADVHIGVGYPGPNPYSRFEDIVRVLDWCADKMIEEKVDLCLFAGDAFKDSKVMLDRASLEIAAFSTWVGKLADAGIHVVIISGTPSHDAIAAYELMKRMFGECRNVDILTAPGLLSDFHWGEYVPEGEEIPSEFTAMRKTAGLGTFVDGFHEINVACIPGMNRSNIMTTEECKGLSPQEVHRLMTGKITDIAQGLRAQVDNDWPTILLSHTTYSEANTGFDQLLQEHEAILTIEAVHGFDLVCLGHIHRAHQAGAQNVFYAGSPERLNFNEESEIPGFWIYGTGESPAKTRFIETPAREYRTLDYGDGFGGKDVEHLIEHPESEAHCREVEDAVVRLRIRAEEEQAKRLDRRKIEAAFYAAGAFFVQEIRIDVERSDRARDREVTESMGPVDALEKWGAQQGIDEGEVAVLKGLAVALLQEVRA